MYHIVNADNTSLSGGSDGKEPPSSVHREDLAPTIPEDIRTISFSSINNGSSCLPADLTGQAALGEAINAFESGIDLADLMFFLFDQRKHQTLAGALQESTGEKGFLSSA